MQAWKDFLSQQETELGAQTVQKWLRSLKVLNFDAGNLYLEASDPFQVLWFEEHIRSRVLSTFLNKNQRPIKVHLCVTKSEETSTKPPLKNSASFKKEAPLSTFELHFDEPESAFSLDTFLSFTENSLASQLALQLCGQTKEALPLASFNPIYIYGPTGSGKTHLLMAIAKTLKEQGLKVIYVRAQTFTEHVIGAIRSGQMQLFRKLYRNVDILLIDDIQVLSRKGATQEELFHTFNTLHLERRQLILSANCAPQELRFVEPRLISRFEWGLSLPLQPLCKKSLVEVISKKAQTLHFPLSKEIAHHLVDTFASSSKAALRALDALIVRAHLEQRIVKEEDPLNLEEAKRYLTDLSAQEEKNGLTPKRIIEAVARYFGIEPLDILGNSQKKVASLPRQIAMYLCRQRLDIAFTAIGETFERHHSTVMASIQRIEELLQVNKSDIAAAVHTILKDL